MKLSFSRRGAVLVVGALLGLLVAGCSETPKQEAESRAPATDPSVPHSYAIALQREDQGNMFGAIMLFEKTVDEHPDFLEAQFKLAEAYTKMGKAKSDLYDKADDMYIRLAGKVGLDDPRLQKGMASLHLARWEIDQAIEIYDKLLASDPDNCEYWVLLGRGQIAKAVQLRETDGVPAEAAQLEAARMSIQHSIDTCPDYIEGYLAMTVILDYDRAYDDIANMYEKLLERFPDNVELQRQHTMARFKGRRWEEASKGFEELLKRDPDPEERLLYVATLRKLDRIDEAEKQMEIYHKTAPKEQTVEELTKLDILKQKLDTQSKTDRAGKLFEDGKVKDALAIWEDVREHVVPYVQDDEFSDAARELLFWLDKRIVLAKKKLEAQT